MGIALGTASAAGTFSARTPATLDEIDARVRLALARHPLCRRLDFDVSPTLLDGYSVSWTVRFRSGGGLCPKEALEIIRDIQDAYQLSAANAAPRIAGGSPPWVQRSNAARAPATLRTMVRP